MSSKALSYYYIFLRQCILPGEFATSTDWVIPSERTGPPGTRPVGQGERLRTGRDGPPRRLVEGTVTYLWETHIHTGTLQDRRGKLEPP